MTFKRFIYFILIASIIFAFSCKAKKCATYDGDGAKHHVNYNKGGLVKKKNKNKGATRSWGGY